MSVVVLDCNSRYSDFLVDALVQQGVAASIAVGLDLIVAADVILVLVGPDSPDAIARIAELRARHPSMLQMVVSDRDDVDLRIAAYDAGADDCLSRPFHLRELVSKLRAMKRRVDRGAATSLLPAAAAVIDAMALEIRVGERVSRLTRREAGLLLALSRAAGRVVQREDVLRESWGAPTGVTGNLVDVYVGYARRKLEEIGADVAIKTVRGEGFRLVERRSNQQPSPYRLRQKKYAS